MRGDVINQAMAVKCPTRENSPDFHFVPFSKSSLDKHGLEHGGRGGALAVGTLNGFRIKNCL